MRKLSMAELGRKTVEEFKASAKMPIVVVLENIRSAYNVGGVPHLRRFPGTGNLYCRRYSSAASHKK